MLESFEGLAPQAFCVGAFWLRGRPGWVMAFGKGTCKWPDFTYTRLRWTCLRWPGKTENRTMKGFWESRTCMYISPFLGSSDSHRYYK